MKHVCRAWALAAALPGVAWAQTAPPVVPAAPRPAAAQFQETSVTLQQAVARQEQNYNRMQNGQGIVVWQEVTQNTAPAARVIHFAFEPERSVTLVLTQEESRAYAARQGKVDWAKALAAHLRVGDLVQSISKSTTSTLPQVRTVPFNPAVHDSNPLVAFHPRILAEDRIALRDLAAALPGLKARPRMSQFTQNGQLRLRVDFVNPNTPGEELYYVLDPAKACLPLEIGRRSQGKVMALTKLVIGNTKDGTWVPARRERTTYDASGTVLTRENWYYEYLALNEGIPPLATSLMFFQLPEGTPVDVPIPPRGYKTVPAGPGAATSATPTPRPTATPQPTRGMRRYL